MCLFHVSAHTHTSFLVFATTLPFKLWILTLVITYTELDSSLSVLGRLLRFAFNSKNQKSSPEKWINPPAKMSVINHKRKLAMHVNRLQRIGCYWFTTHLGALLPPRAGRQVTCGWQPYLTRAAWARRPDGLQTGRDAGLMFRHEQHPLLIRSIALSNVLNN